MKTSSLTRIALALLLPAFVPAFTASAAVTLTGPNLVEADVSNFLDSQTESDAPTALPYLNTVTALADDDSSATTANLTSSAFIFTFNQIASFSKVSGKGDLFFTVSADTQYNLTGQFGADDATFGLNLSATLLDTSNPESPLYHSSQAGSYNSAKSLILGGSQGSDTNILSGSPTGTLSAGKTYEFIVNAGFEAPTDPNGTGTVTLAFAPVTGPGGGPSAPLPPAIWVGAIFATGLLVWKHRTARSRRLHLRMSLSKSMAPRPVLMFEFRVALSRRLSLPTRPRASAIWTRALASTSESAAHTSANSATRSPGLSRTPIP